jgi:CheY-like chemotaxis protein
MKKEILVIDDDNMVLFLHDYFVAESFPKIPVQSFNYAINAFDYITKNWVKNIEWLVFLDVNMPVMDGWELLEKLQVLASSITRLNVVMITSSINPLDMEKSNQYPLVIDFLEKPLSIESCIKLQTSDRLVRFMTPKITA